MSKKRILITGSNGLLGQKLVYALKEKPEVELIATARGKNRLVEQEGYVFEPMDISDEEAVNKVILKHQPDVVINTAAMTNVDACEENREECWKLNVDAVQYLIDACNKAKAHLIHLSTDFIFNGENGPYKEDDKADPLSYYGKSKLESERIVREKANKWTIIRTVLVYGVVDNMSRSNIVLWAKEALEKRKPLTIVDDQFRTPTLAEDLAQGCVLAAMKGATGVYNISGKDYMNILELVYRVADYFNLPKDSISPISSETLNQAAKRPPKTGFILEKAKNELGYHPHSFEEGIKIIQEQASKVKNT